MPDLPGWSMHGGQPVDAAFQTRRRDLLLAAFADFRPDVVIIEAFPFGRRQVRFELLPLLDAVAAARPRPLLVCSLRDILQERSKPGRDEESVALVRGAISTGCWCMAIPASCGWRTAFRWQRGSPTGWSTPGWWRRRLRRRRPSASTSWCRPAAGRWGAT